MQTLEQLWQVLAVTLAVFSLVMMGVIFYVLWLLIQLHQEVRRLRSPEVERDANGKRIKQRV